MAFEWDVLDKYLDILDSMELWLMFDMSKCQLSSHIHSKRQD